MSTDAELLARIIVEDDREAFEVLLKKYQSPIRAFFRKMCGGDDALADDLSQETYEEEVLEPFWIGALQKRQVLPEGCVVDLHLGPARQGDARTARTWGGAHMFEQVRLQALPGHEDSRRNLAAPDVEGQV